MSKNLRQNVWLAREILGKYDGQIVGQYISYNSLPLLEERLVPVDLINLAKWIKEQLYYINPSGRTIRTDCGNGYKTYSCECVLGAIRLNDMKEFYV